MKKWLIRLVCVLLVALAALYWQRVFTIDQQLERVASGLAEYGQLSWESILIDPRGRAIVGDVAFRPHREPGTIRVESMTLRSSDLIELIPRRTSADRQPIPEHWFLELKGLRLPIGPPVAGWPLETLGLLLPFRSRACSGFEQSTLEDLVKLGYGRLEMDLRLEAQSREGLLLVDLDLDIQDLSETRQRFELNSPAPSLEPGDLQALLAGGSLLTMNHRIQDRGLLRRLDAACAVPQADSGDLQEAHFRAWLRTWTDLGLEPGAIVQAAFRHHLEQPSLPISISAKPGRDLPLSDLFASPDRDLIQTLGLSFAMADGPDVSLDLREVAPTTVVAPPAADDAQTTGILRSEDNQESIIVVGRPPAWERIPLDTIAAYIDNQARIELIDGTQLTGRLAGLEDDQLQLTTQSRSGEFARPLPLSDIVAIEVRP